MIDFDPIVTNQLATDLTQSRVEVSSSFQGAKVILYGATLQPDGPPPDVVVVVRGPETDLRLMRKTRVAGLWLNSRPMVFEGAPGFYMAASSRPLTEIARNEMRYHLGLGLDYMPMEVAAETAHQTGYADWRRAVVRLQQKNGLYSDNPAGVRFIDRHLFRAEVELPSDAPIGSYTAEVWLFRNGLPVNYSVKPLTVEKVGFERFVYDFAHRHAWIYGLICVLMSMSMGLIASRLFRRR